MSIICHGSSASNAIKNAIKLAQDSVENYLVESIREVMEKMDAGGLVATVPKELISAGIAGVGVYLPNNIVTNEDLEKTVDTSTEWIISRSGIRERRIAPATMASSDFAVAAARAIAGAGITAEEIDLVIVATNTPDMVFPATACLVQERIG